MNWLECTRREIRECASLRTANTAERTLTAVTAVPHCAFWRKSTVSPCGNGGAQTLLKRIDEDAVLEYAVAAAVAEIDGGLSLSEVVRAAWALIVNRHQVH
jgi:hypothetical protein